MDLPIALLANYTVFSLFTFYQKLHIKDFEGPNQLVLLVLNICFLSATVFRIGFVLYYGYEVSWVGAVILFLVASIVRFTWFTLEIKLGINDSFFTLILSFLGLIALPLCAYFMWTMLLLG